MPSSEPEASPAGSGDKSVFVPEPGTLAPPNVPNTAAESSNKSVHAAGTVSSALSDKPQQTATEVAELPEHTRAEVKQEPPAATPAGAGAAVTENAVGQQVASDAKAGSSHNLPPSSALQPSTEDGTNVSGGIQVNASGGINMAGALQRFRVVCARIK